VPNPGARKSAMLYYGMKQLDAEFAHDKIIEVHSKDEREALVKSPPRKK